ncbi:hypothetical protein HI914_02272 [Erysiphe necator]|nr:hypothetical protein HI914_02272 [Erysiphe necator]
MNTMLGYQPACMMKNARDAKSINNFSGEWHENGTQRTMAELDRTLAYLLHPGYESCPDVNEQTTGANV